MKNYASQNAPASEFDEYLRKDLSVDIDALLNKVSEDSLSGYLSEKFGPGKEITKVNYEGGYVSAMMKESNDEIIEESEQLKETGRNLNPQKVR